MSRDNGATFTKGATNFGSRVISMAADPFEDILYAATGSRGVFRSLDGGTTWEAAGDGGTPFNLLKIIADPVRRGRLYASTTNGVFRSTDAARTWEHIGLTYSSGELVITPDGRWLYAGTSGGVFELDLGASDPCPPDGTRRCIKPPEPPCRRGTDSPRTAGHGRPAIFRGRLRILDPQADP